MAESRARDSITGQFVTEDYASENPETTQIETTAVPLTVADRIQWMGDNLEEIQQFTGDTYDTWLPSKRAILLKINGNTRRIDWGMTLVRMSDGSFWIEL